MAKRYREALSEVEVEPGAGHGASGRPRRFTWRGRRYRVLEVLGHWREETGWWQRPGDRPVRPQQADRWRVEASGGAVSRGVYELVCRGGRWTLDRVWD